MRLHEQLVGSATNHGWLTQRWHQGVLRCIKHNTNMPRVKKFINEIIVEEGVTEKEAKKQAFKYYWDFLQEHSFVPDAWRISVNEDKILLEFLEVDVSHPLSRYRIMNYAYFMEEMGEDDFNIRLVVMDRYGTATCLMATDEVPARYDKDEVFWEWDWHQLFGSHGVTPDPKEDMKAHYRWADEHVWKISPVEEKPVKEKKSTKGTFIPKARESKKSRGERLRTYWLKKAEEKGL